MRRVSSASRRVRKTGQESNPVAEHSDLEASLPQSFPHPARRACRASTVSVLGSGSACVVTARCVLPCTMRLMTVVCASYAATR